jgi:hypothetical protein
MIFYSYKPDGYYTVEETILKYNRCLLSLITILEIEEYLIKSYTSTNKVLHMCDYCGSKGTYLFNKVEIFEAIIILVKYKF